MEPTGSIIVPVYNAEEYLRRLMVNLLPDAESVLADKMRENIRKVLGTNSGMPGNI